MPDPRDELALADMANDPNILRLTVRPQGVVLPPPSDVDTGWGPATGPAGRPAGRLFEPDQEPVRPTIGERIGISPVESWPSWGDVGRGIGSLVQGAGDFLSRPPSEPEGGSRLSPVPLPAVSDDPFQRAAQRTGAKYGAAAQERPTLPAALAQGVVNIPSDIQQGYEASQARLDPSLTQEQRDAALGTAAEKAFGITSNLAGTSAPFARAGTAGVFGGRLAKGFDPNKEKLAETMLQNGVPAPQIWKETGMVKFADGKWAHEISDLGAHYVGDNFKTRLKIQQGEQLYLPDVINHPELFKRYPELLKMPVSQDAMMHAQGAYSPHIVTGTDVRPASIAYREQNQPGKMARGATFDTLLHEVQHAIQQIEGFAKGTSTDRDLSLIPGTGANKIYLEEMKKFSKPLDEHEFTAVTPDSYKLYLDDYLNRWRAHDESSQYFAAQQAYPRSAGERVAELPPLRKDLTPEQAAAIHPPSQFSVPMDQQFVEYNRLVNPAGTVPQAQMSAPTLRGKAADEAWRGIAQEPKLRTTVHPYSNVGGTPIREMESPIIKGAPKAPPRLVDIEKDLSNAEFIFTGGDATGAGGKLYGSKELPFETPVGRFGGPGYGQIMQGKKIEGHPGASPVWATMKSPMGEILNIARDVERRGKEPWQVYMTGGKQYLDSSMQMVNTAIQAAKAKGVSDRMNEYLFNVMRSDWNTAADPKRLFPETGLKNEKALREWIDNSPQPQRAKLVKAMDSVTARSLGFPDMGQLRVWNTDARMITAPPGSAGLSLARIDPSIGMIPSHHPAYATGIGGRDLGTLGMQVPHQIIAPTMHESRMATLNKPQYYTAAPHLYFPGGGTHATKTEPVTNKLKDILQRWMLDNPTGLAGAGIAGTGGIGSLVQPNRQEVY